MRQTLELDCPLLGGRLCSQVVTFSFLSNSGGVPPHPGSCVPELLSTVNWLLEGQGDMCASVLAAEGRG